MLTTASITFSATSAILSGPRCAPAGNAGNTITAAASAKVATLAIGRGKAGMNFASEPAKFLGNMGLESP